MSKIEVDIIGSVTGGAIVVGPELVITDSSESRVVLSAGMTSGVSIYGPIYTGTKYDYSAGISGQLLFSNGPTMPPTWRYPEVPRDIQYEKKTILPYIVTYNTYCATSTSRTLPNIPSTDPTADWVYCDGFNGTPDYRINNPGATNSESSRKFPLIASANVFVTLEITGPTTDIRKLYEWNVQGSGNRKLYYDPAGSMNGGITLNSVLAPVQALVVSITGPTNSSNRPLHTKATVVVSGATAQGVTQGWIPGDLYRGIPQDFISGGYLKFRDATGPTFTVLSVNGIRYDSYESVVNYSAPCQYTKSLTYIMRV